MKSTIYVNEKKPENEFYNRTILGWFNEHIALVYCEINLFRLWSLVHFFKEIHLIA